MSTIVDVRRLKVKTLKPYVRHGISVVPFSQIRRAAVLASSMTRNSKRTISVPVQWHTAQT
jgi:hypothetical protein